MLGVTGGYRVMEPALVHVALLGPTAGGRARGATQD